MEDVEVDIAYIGSSPVILIDAYCQVMSGANVLIIENQPAVGGAWRQVSMDGIRDLEFAHILEPYPGVYEFLTAQLELPMEDVRDDNFIVSPVKFLGREIFQYSQWWAHYLQRMDQAAFEAADASVANDPSDVDHQDRFGRADKMAYFPNGTRAFTVDLAGRIKSMGGLIWCDSACTELITAPSDPFVEAPVTRNGDGGTEATVLAKKVVTTTGVGLERVIAGGAAKQVAYTQMPGVGGLLGGCCL